MTFTNYRNFTFSNKTPRKENKKDELKPSYNSKGDYEKVMENIEIGCNDEEAKNALKNFNNVESKIT